MPDEPAQAKKRPAALDDDKLERVVGGGWNARSASTVSVWKNKMISELSESLKKVEDTAQSISQNQK